MSERRGNELAHDGGPAGLVVLGRAGWPAGGAATPPRPVAGFAGSPFAGLAVHVADACLSQVFHRRPVPPQRGDRIGIVLASRRGDVVTAAAIGNAVTLSKRIAPLLFFQSVPNAVAGRIASTWGLCGPLVCTSPAGDPLADGIALARLLICDGDADEMLVVVIELSTADSGRDHAGAVFLGPVGPAPTNRPEDNERTNGHGKCPC